MDYRNVIENDGKIEIKEHRKACRTARTDDIDMFRAGESGDKIAENLTIGGGKSFFHAFDVGKKAFRQSIVAYSLM